VNWFPAFRNPAFTAQGPGAWDAKIRERGWILRNDAGYHLWYTGYDGTREGIKRLGYATSVDGLTWTRWTGNPLVTDHWVEDMMIVSHGGTYYMFAEGADAGHAELFTSKNGVDWQGHGPLDIRQADGLRPAKRPCGTPTVWIENGIWYLFYEWHDRGVWLAASRDPISRVWINVRDEPVLVPGPATYDHEMIALNQVIKHKGAYFAFYHGCGGEQPRVWNTHIARSLDLVQWQKYAGNPIVAGNRSSGIVVPDGRGLRLYTMHDQVEVFVSEPYKRSLTPRRVDCCKTLSRCRVRDRERVLRRVSWPRRLRCSYVH
jgi:sucrose-6-phosphate hydrolase SacC (GH32 family)